MEFTFVGTYSAAGWDDWFGSDVRVDDGGVTLSREPFPTYVSPDLAVEGLDAIDLDVDPCGALYVLSADGSLYRYDHERGSDHRVPCLGADDGFGDSAALCVTGDTVYLGSAGDDSAEPTDGPPGRMRALSTHLLQTRWVADWTSHGDERRRLGRPIALAEGDGVVYLLERGPADAGYVSALDETGAATTVIEGVTAPLDAATDDEGNLSVLAREGAAPVVWRFDAADLGVDGGPITPGADHRWIAPVALDRPVSIETAEAGELLVGVDPDTDDERVLYRYRIDTAGDDGTLDRVAAFKRSCLGLRLARGRTGGRIRGLYAIDGTTGDVYRLDEEYHNRRDERTGGYDARIVTRYDASDPRTEWHRARVEFDVGEPNTRVYLRYRATDDPEPLGDVTEVAGIGATYAERLRDAGVTGISGLLAREADAIGSITGAPAATVDGWLAQAWDRFDAWFAPGGDPPGSARADPRDALFDDATGQYLWVALELIGTETASPRIDSVRAYLPRQSYLRYLPAVYQEDAESAAFLERFLSVFESTFVDIEEDVEGLTRLLDAWGIPAPHLAWLGRWLAVETDETWSDAARRELVSRAADLYRMRGTREGILAVVGIYLGRSADDDPASDPTAPNRATTTASAERTDARGHCRLGDGGGQAADDPEGVGPYLVEYGDLDCIDDADALRDYRRLVSCPQCFLVLVGPSVGRERVRAIQRIVDAEQPAHAVGRVVGLDPSIRLGEHSYLGINTALSDRSFAVEHSELGTDSVLGDREPYAQVGRRSRVGEDSVLS